MRLDEIKTEMANDFYDGTIIIGAKDFKQIKSEQIWALKIGLIDLAFKGYLI